MIHNFGICRRIVPHAELRSSHIAEQIILMAMPQKHHWTVDEVERLIDEQEERGEHIPIYELLDGELLVSPAPSDRHQIAAGRLYSRLMSYTDVHRVGMTMISPSAVRLTADSRLQPDVYVRALVKGDTMPGNRRLTKLLLVVEVISPSSRRTDRTKKRQFYQRNRVPQYWVVDGDDEAFEIWYPDSTAPIIVSDELVWTPSNDHPSWKLDVRDFFVTANADASTMEHLDVE